jgi:alkylation response protein AidB-like acyl-CoA dehydrogenase
LTGARALLGAATHDGDRPAALLAKAAAGRAHDQVSREAIQVCGAIGLSAEFPLARYVRRGYLLDAFLSPARSIERDHGQALLNGAAPASVGQF